MKTLLILVLFAAAFTVNAQAAEVTIESFLASAPSDAALEGQNAKLKFLSTASPNTPYFDHVEFRTRTDELQGSQQTYILRFYPTGWGETSNGRRLFEATIQANKAQLDMLLHQVLGKRYRFIIDYRYQHAQAALNSRLLQLEEDRVSALKRTVETADFDLTDLLKAESDVVRLQIETVEQENELHAVEMGIRQRIGAEDVIAFSSAPVIDPYALGRVVLQLGITPAADAENIYLRDSQLRVEEKQCAYDLAKSQSRRYISYLEALYDNEERGHSREMLAFEVGIRLPFINADRLDINRRELEYLEERRVHEDLKQTLQQEKTQLCEEVQRLLTQYRRLALTEEHGGSKASRVRYEQMEGADPLILLTMKENMLKRDLALNELQHRLYSAYIDLLDLSGRLSRQPLRNYLSAEQEDIRQ